MVTIVEIDVNKILMDVANARFNTAEATNQIETRERMFALENMDRKMLALTEHIAKHGRDPSAPLLVYKRGDDEYVVLDGNRRLLAVKMLLDPAICPRANRRSSIQKYSTMADLSSLQKAWCAIVDRPENADVWMELKHTGQNDGAGQVEWSTMSKEAHRARRGRAPHAGIQILKFIDSDADFDPDIKAKSQDINVTNLQRLFQSPPAKQAFGLKQDSKKLVSIISVAKFRTIVEHVVRDLLQPNFGVSAIYTKTDRERYLSTLPQNLHITPSDRIETPWTVADPDFDSMSPTQRGKRPGKKKRRSASSRRTRTYLIDKILHITEPRINDIYRELRQVSVLGNPNMVSVTWRVFLELSCDAYISANQVHRGNSRNALTRDDKLRDKLIGLIQHLTSTNKITNEVAKSLTNLARVERYDQVTTLNAFVHSYTVSPGSEDLNIDFDNWFPLIEAIWP